MGTQAPLEVPITSLERFASTTLERYTVMLRHSSKRSCRGSHGQPWPITRSRCSTRLTERIPHAKRPTCNVGVLSRSQCRRKAQLAVRSYKAPIVKHNAATVAARLWRPLFCLQYILWLANLYRKNSRLDRHNRDISVNLTAMAVLSLRRRVDVYLGLPSVVFLWNRCGDVATAVVTAQTTLLTAVQDIVGSPVTC